MTKTITIHFDLYTTQDGRPTCRLSPDETCPFLFARVFGQKYLCGAIQERVEGYGKNNCDFLKPAKECFLRKEGMIK